MHRSSSLSARPYTPAAESATRQTNSPSGGQNQTVLGTSLLFHGELSGNDDVMIEGQMAGSITIQDNCLTIGPEAHVKADIRARKVIVWGNVEGNIAAQEKIEIHKTGKVVGDLHAAAISVEEGAFFKGSIDIVGRNAGARGEPTPATPESNSHARDDLGLVQVEKSAGTKD